MKRLLILILCIMFVITNVSNATHYYIVSGNSMNPTFNNGDIVKLEEKNSYNNGEVVVANVGGKKVIKRIDGDKLVGDNKQASASYNLSTANIIGKAEYNTDKLTDEEKKEFEKVFASGVEMIVGGYHTLALKSDGTVWAWGFSPLGDGTYMDASTPIQVKGVGGIGYLTDIEQIAAGFGHKVALKSDGTVYAWGINNYGQVGDNTKTDKIIPIQVKGVGGTGYLTDIIQIKASTGGGCTVALKSDGTVYTWGDNRYGQLGDNTTTEGLTPTQVKGVGGTGYLTGITQISSGEFHALALKNDGTVWAWGGNGAGALGDNTTTGRLTPIQVKGVGGVGNLTDIAQISASGSYTLALKNDGTVLAWGANTSGKLGDNTTTSRYTPVQVKGVGGIGYLSGIVQVTAGFYHAVALKSDGTVLAWGGNEYGQLGDNTTTNRYVPVQVVGVGGIGYLSEIIRIGATIRHTLAIKNDGTVLAWGNNQYGQLGNNTTTDSTTPVQVKGISGIGNFNILDTTSPTCTITASPSTNPTNVSSITYTFTFSEPVTGFAKSSITVSNGTKGTFTAISSTVYTQVVTNTGSCNQIVSVAAGKCTDASGNSNVSASITITIDRTAPAAPTFTSSTTAKTNQDVIVTISYSADTTTRQYRLNSDPVGVWTDYTGPIVMTGNGTIYAKALDAVGNQNTSASLSIANIDKINPTATINYSTLVVTNENVIATLVPSETVTVTNNGGLFTYTFTQNGLFTFEFVDQAGNTGSKTAMVNNINSLAMGTPVLSPSTTSQTDKVIVTITYPENSIKRQCRIGSGEWMDYIEPLEITSNIVVHARCSNASETQTTESSLNIENIQVNDTTGDISLDKRKHFRYYLGIGKNGVTQCMLVAGNNDGNVIETFERTHIIDESTNKFKCDIFYVDSYGKIKKY